jgi:hypothetical protein
MSMRSEGSRIVIRLLYFTFLIWTPIMHIILHFVILISYQFVMMSVNNFAILSLMALY